MAALLDGNFFLGFVALFVFVSVWQEREQIRSRAELQGYQVRQAMQPVGMRLHPLQTLGDLGGQLASSAQSTYLVMDGGRLVGLMSRSDLLTALRRGGERRGSTPICVARSPGQPG